MTKITSLVTGAAAIAAGVGILLVDETLISRGELAVSAANAVVGRPVTPVSYAGVARRTTRRVVGAAAATTTCVQKVDAYGRVVTVCK